MSFKVRLVFLIFDFYLYSMNEQIFLHFVCCLSVLISKIQMAEASKQFEDAFEELLKSNPVRQWVKVSIFLYLVLSYRSN